MAEDEALTDTAVILVVADEPGAAVAGERAVTAGGSRRVVGCGWREAPAVAVDTARLSGIYADARGMAGSELERALPALIEATHMRLVVEIDRAQIDTAAPMLLTTDAVLLCEADAVERTAALMLMTAADGLSVHDTSRDARRYEQINAEVARFAETLARLTQAGDPERSLPDASPFVADRTSGFAAQPSAGDIDPADIRRAIRARRMRDDAFDRPGLFEDPAWDMLLDLFAAELERRQVSVSSLCIAAAVAPTTALRWIGKLASAGLLERRPDEFDRRRAYISLSARASTALRNYVAALRRAGLALA